jgi:hypothetical protein
MRLTAVFKGKEVYPEYGVFFIRALIPAPTEKNRAGIGN